MPNSPTFPIRTAAPSRPRNELLGRHIDRDRIRAQKVARHGDCRARVMPRGSPFRSPTILSLVPDGVRILARYSPRLFGNRDDPSSGWRNVGIHHPAPARSGDSDISRDGSAFFAAVFRITGSVRLVAT